MRIRKKIKLKIPIALIMLAALTSHLVQAELLLSEDEQAWLQAHPEIRYAVDAMVSDMGGEIGGNEFLTKPVKTAGTGCDY